jgi:hypothetical protein
MMSILWKKVKLTIFYFQMKTFSIDWLIFLLHQYHSVKINCVYHLDQSFADKSYVCDGDNDCGNNYDEESCEPLVCAPNQFKCALDGICINSTRRCDGIYDCPSSTDEDGCRTSSAIQRSCRQNEFQCNSNPGGALTSTGRLVCIPQAWKCDGHVDCENGSDESQTCSRNVSCNPGFFKCSNLRCIPTSWTCGKYLILELVANCLLKTL